MPTATAMTISWSTLNDRPIEPVVAGAACRPRMLPGTRPVRKSHQRAGASPASVGAAASTRACCGRAGEQARGRCRWTTAISAVMANQSRVCPASRAALETCLQVGDADDDGGDDQRRDERPCSSVTKVPPMVSRVLVSQFGRAVGDGADLAGDEAEDDAERRGRGGPAPRTGRGGDERAREVCLSEVREEEDDGSGGRQQPAVVTRPKSRARRRVRPHRFCTAGSMRGTVAPAVIPVWPDHGRERQRVGLPVKSPSVTADRTAPRPGEVPLTQGSQESSPSRLVLGVHRADEPGVARAWSRRATRSTTHGVARRPWSCVQRGSAGEVAGLAGPQAAGEPQPLVAARRPRPA